MTFIPTLPTIYEERNGLPDENKQIKTVRFNNKITVHNYNYNYNYIKLKYKYKKLKKYLLKFLFKNKKINNN